MLGVPSGFVFPCGIERVVCVGRIAQIEANIPFAQQEKLDWDVIDTVQGMSITK